MASCVSININRQYIFQIDANTDYFTIKNYDRCCCGAMYIIQKIEYRERTRKPNVWIIYKTCFICANQISACWTQQEVDQIIEYYMKTDYPAFKACYDEIPSLSTNCD